MDVGDLKLYQITLRYQDEECAKYATMSKEQSFVLIAKEFDEAEAYARLRISKACGYDAVVTSKTSHVIDAILHSESLMDLLKTNTPHS